MDGKAEDTLKFLEALRNLGIAKWSGQLPDGGTGDSFHVEFHSRSDAPAPEVVPREIDLSDPHDVEDIRGTVDQAVTDALAARGL